MQKNLSTPPFFTLLEGALLDEGGYAVDDGVFFILGWVETVLHVHSEEAADGLIETCPERTEERLDDVIGVLVGLTGNELEKDFALAFRHAFHDGFILLHDVFLKTLEVLFPGFLVGQGLDIFVGLCKGGKRKLGVGESLAHVSHCSPIKFLLLLVLEFQGRIDNEIVEHRHPDRVAIFIHESIEPLEDLHLNSGTV